MLFSIKYDLLIDVIRRVVEHALSWSEDPLLGFVLFENEMHMISMRLYSALSMFIFDMKFLLSYVHLRSVTSMIRC